MRLLNIAIPVQIKDDGDPLSQRVAAALRRSPRLRHDPNGFTINVKRADGKLAIDLSNTNDEDTKRRRNDEAADAQRRAKFHPVIVSFKGFKEVKQARAVSAVSIPVPMLDQDRKR